MLWNGSEEDENAECEEDEGSNCEDEDNDTDWQRQLESDMLCVLTVGN